MENRWVIYRAQTECPNIEWPRWHDAPAVLDPHRMTVDIEGNTMRLHINSGTPYSTVVYGNRDGSYLSWNSYEKFMDALPQNTQSVERIIICGKDLTGFGSPATGTRAGGNQIRAAKSCS